MTQKATPVQPTLAAPLSGYVPPSEWTNEETAKRLDKAIVAMLAPTDPEEMPQYRATIRVMRVAEKKLRAAEGDALADAYRQGAEAMREAAIDAAAGMNAAQDVVDAIRALPLEPPK